MTKSTAKGTKRLKSSQFADPPCRPFDVGALVIDPCPTCSHPIADHAIRGPYCVKCE
jgi:hypothetical protein